MSASVGKSTSNLYAIITTGGGEDTFLWNVNVFSTEDLFIVILQSDPCTTLWYTFISAPGCPRHLKINIVPS